MPGGSDANQAARCPLCGEPNRCALEMPEDERPAQCWCVGLEFPASLTERAPGGACICRACQQAAASGDADESASEG